MVGGVVQVLSLGGVLIVLYYNNDVAAGGERFLFKVIIRCLFHMVTSVEIPSACYGHLQPPGKRRRHVTNNNPHSPRRGDALGGNGKVVVVHAQSPQAARMVGAWAVQKASELPG